MRQARAFPAPLPTHQDHLRHRATESESRVRTHLRTQQAQHPQHDSGHNAGPRKSSATWSSADRVRTACHGSGAGPFAQPHGQHWQKVPTVAKGVQQLAATSPFAARASADGRSHMERISALKGALASPPSPTSSYAMPCSAAKAHAAELETLRSRPCLTTPTSSRTARDGANWSRRSSQTSRSCKLCRLLVSTTSRKPSAAR